jgi:hypothetical protein
MDGVTISGDGLAAREDNIANVATAFVWGFGAEHPRVSALQT